MDCGPGKPEGESCREGNRQRKLAAEAEEGGGEKEDSWYDPPEHTAGVAGHKPEVPGVVQVEPEEDQERCQGHGSDQAAECRMLPADLGTDDYYEVGYK